MHIDRMYKKEYTVTEYTRGKLPPRRPMSLRQAGVLLHIASLSTPYAIGTFGKSAYRWIDFLAQARMQIWQVLPLVPTGESNSPYSSDCASALNPYFIDPDMLAEQGLLQPKECKRLQVAHASRIDYSLVAQLHLPALRLAFSRFDRKSPDFAAYVASGKSLEFARFRAAKQRYDGAPWCDWEADLRDRTPAALAKLDAECADEIAFWQWTQYEAAREWNAVHAYARQKGIAIMGDMPMYVSYDSVEVWSKRTLFDLDPVTGRSVCVAGVPPDYFSPDGQLWGNPLYAWETNTQACMDWWRERIDDAMQEYDCLRIDHFRAFDRYYAVPADATDAKNGIWKTGKGRELFCSTPVHADLIAEDLGIIDDSVRELIARTGFPGMRVMQFGMDGNPDNDHKPTRFCPNVVAYTGTHDNNTLYGFLQELDEDGMQTFVTDLRLQCALHGVPLTDETPAGLHEACIRLLYASLADRIMLPLQDMLMQDAEARMNTPGTVGPQNWSYRMPEELDLALAAHYAQLAQTYRRTGETVDLSDDGHAVVRYTRFGTLFRLWSPTGDDMRLRLYRDDKAAMPMCDLGMHRDGEFYTTWVGGDLHGVYYTYVCRGRESVDPCAIACGTNGQRAMVVDLRRTDPDGWVDDRNPSCMHPVIWEVHVRDMSVDPTLACSDKGKYTAFRTGIRTPNGYTASIDYLRELGVTHVQLLPVADFCTVDETNPTQRNWGYDPWLMRAPEGSYASDPSDGAARIRELKQLIANLHAAGIGVILDVVYNHTYYSERSNLEILAPDCYYRKKDGRFLNASGCGNEIATERDGVRAWILDSIRYWAQEYHVDGFRFDLMACIDVDTLHAIRAELDEIEQRENRRILTYGEPWSALPVAPWVEPSDMHHTTRLGDRIGVFNGIFRDAMRGNNHPSRGYIQGNKFCVPTVIAGVEGFCGHVPEHYLHSRCVSPAQQIVYLSAHDDYSLYDQLAITMPHDDDGARLTANKLGAFLLFSSLGIPFLQAGEEFARTKHKDKNSYRSPDSINALDWTRRETYDDLVQFYRGLIDIRKHNPVFADLTTAREQFEWLAHDGEYGVLVYRIGKFLYAVNPTLQPVTLDLSGYGKLRLLADWDRADYGRQEFVSGNVCLWQRNLLCLEITGEPAETE